MQQSSSAEIRSKKRIVALDFEQSTYFTCHVGILTWFYV